MTDKNVKEYHCDGVCEDCKYGKLFADNSYSCDDEKIKDIKIVVPHPKSWRSIK